LVDELTSETGSKEYVTYSIMPISKLVQGTNIQNKAYIYFDNNPPIRTNTTSSIIDSVSAVGISKIERPSLFISCFPVPFITTTTIEFSTSNKHYLEVDDITGRKVEVIECAGFHYELQRNNLASGVYFIKAWDNGNNYIATTKLIAQ
ncbi:MAG TPA: T9SS type A sorting domain-containing protein, partial [Bacteroidia bacterium]|nr:T9SS type A sorting domain-containing protein [Bacteroidia bacterium]